MALSELRSRALTAFACGSGVRLPAVVESALQFAAPAAFAAISIPIVLGGDGFADFGSDVRRILAVTLACAVVWKSRNIPLSLATGMGALWLLLWLT